MRKTIAISMVLILVVSILVLTPTAAATKPDDIEIFFELGFSVPGSAAGIYFISGLIEDSGSASMIYRNAGKTVHCEIDLINKEGFGELKIILQGQGTLKEDESGTISGRFTIIHGTGDFADLHGVGSFIGHYNGQYMDLSCNGKAHLD